jgi:hypothetical protein
MPIRLLSAATVEKLTLDVPANLERYTTGDFLDLAKESGWAIETAAVKWDDTVVSKLSTDPTPEAEVRNSLLIFDALPGMTAATARDERIWARLCHIECLDYVRARWLRSGANVEARIRAHFFAPGLPGCRDDNAIGRLWWNVFVARLANPADPESALTRLLARANIRLQIIDRADTAFRQPLVAGIARVLQDSWFNTYDAAVADFMFEVNKASGGIIFEALSDAQVDAHLQYCLTAAREKARISAAN